MNYDAVGCVDSLIVQRVLQLVSDLCRHLRHVTSRARDPDDSPVNKAYIILNAAVFREDA